MVSHMSCGCLASTSQSPTSLHWYRQLVEETSGLWTSPPSTQVSQRYAMDHSHSLLDRCDSIHWLLQYTHPDQVTEKAPSGCYVSGLYLEGAKWDLERGCLTKSLPKVLIEELPVLRVIPIEAHRLKLVVSLQRVLMSTCCYYNCYYVLPF